MTTLGNGVNSFYIKEDENDGLKKNNNAVWKIA